MSLKKRYRTEYPETQSDYNTTRPDNPSHFVDQDTSWVLRDITLESLDGAIWQEFNNRFIVANKAVNLIMLDADIASMQFENPQQFDTANGYLNFPYFTIWRNKTAPKTRTSPSNKPTTYIVPVTKAQGVVYEEYRVPPPIMLELTYVFKFLTTYRQYTNEMEQHMLEYFKNKRNVIDFEGERFEVAPASQFELAELDVADREGVNGQSLYVLTWTITMYAYTRNSKDVQKRERPNSYNITITEKGKIEADDTITQFETRLPKILPPNIEPSNDI